MNEEPENVGAQLFDAVASLPTTSANLSGPKLAEIVASGHGDFIKSRATTTMMLITSCYWNSDITRELMSSSNRDSLYNIYEQAEEKYKSLIKEDPSATTIRKIVNPDIF